MREAVIIGGLHSPAVRSGGDVPVHPVDLAAAGLSALVHRTGIDPAVVDEVLLGTMHPTEDRTGQVARSAVLAAGFPTTTLAAAVCRVGGSAGRDDRPSRWSGWTRPARSTRRPTPTAAPSPPGTAPAPLGPLS